MLFVTLNITEGDSQLDPLRSQANVTIRANDEAFGVIEFSKDTYVVHEKNRNITARVPIVRKQGTHGALKVYYRCVL